MERRTKRGAEIKRRKSARNPLAILVELTVLSLLVAAAFYAPQAVFQVQDTILCGTTSLGERERMDVEALGTTYEKSLSQRMFNFAEGLEAGANFYVTSQDLPIGDEIYEYTESEAFLYDGLLRLFADADMIHPEFWWKKEPQVITQWKQYVIYSDDYAKGVNFILWYVEMRCGQDIVLKVLADTEDGTIYAFRQENNGEQFGTVDNRLWNETTLMDIWFFFSRRYEAKYPEEMEETVYKLEIILAADGVIDGYINEPYRHDKSENGMSVWTGSEWSIRDQVTGYMMERMIALSETGNEILFRLPYGETASLEMKIHVAEDDVVFDNLGYKYLWFLPNFTVGIRQIYEMIPEFE